MSKFIRTKDGIFEIRTISDEPIIDFDGKPDYEDTRAVYTTTDERHTYYYGEDVIKQADTIDELCDEFVLTKFQEVFKIDKYSKHFVKQALQNGDGDVYSAIWTEWGLKYVAKMDEDGELVLI